MNYPGEMSFEVRREREQLPLQSAGAADLYSSFPRSSDCETRGEGRRNRTRGRGRGLRQEDRKLHERLWNIELLVLLHWESEGCAGGASEGLPSE